MIVVKDVENDRGWLENLVKDSLLTSWPFLILTLDLISPALRCCAHLGGRWSQCCYSENSWGSRRPQRISDAGVP